MGIWTVDTHVSVTVEANTQEQAIRVGGNIIEEVLEVGNDSLGTSAYIGDDIDAWKE